MLLVDVHAHLDHERFKGELDAVLRRAKQAGIVKILNSGTNQDSNRVALHLSDTYDIIEATLGLYPTLVDTLTDEQINNELDFIRSKKDSIFGVGECGLDYNEDASKIAEQKDMFQKIIEVVERIKKPIVIHSRKAELDCIEILESSKIKKVVMHSFGGKKSLIKRAADLGFTFSVPPVITRLQHFETLVGLVDISQLLTETDAPYLSPYAGERNEPAFVKETIKKIAEIKNMTEDDVANNVYMNYTNVFL